MRHNCSKRITPNYSSYARDDLSMLYGMFMVTGLISFEQTQNKYFQRFLELLNFNPPCSEGLSRVVLRNLVKKIVVQLYKKLNNSCKTIHLTMDLWSSNSCKYVGITGSWLKLDWTSDSCVLGMFPCVLDDSFVISALEIKRIFDEVVELYQINRKIYSITIDNGQDMISFSNQTGVPFFRCGAHCLQLGIKDLLNTEYISGLLLKVKFIVKTISNSIKLQVTLSKSWPGYAISNKIDVDTFTQIPKSNSTRWNSTYYMLESFLSYWDFILFVFPIENWPKNWHAFSEAQLRELNLIRSCLEPLTVANLDLQKKNIPTITKVIPLLVEILLKFITLEEKFNANEIYKDFKALVYKNVIEYLQHLFESNIIIGILYLHPGLKDFEWCRNLSDLKIIPPPNELSITGKLWVKSEMTKEKNIPLNSKPTPPNNFFANIDDNYSFQVSNRFRNIVPSLVNNNPITIISNELNAYDVINIDPKICALEYWKNCRAFPYISSVAMKWILLPLSSADVERCFSVSTRINTKTRTSLSSEHVSQIHFIHCNQHFFDCV